MNIRELYDDVEMSVCLALNEHDDADVMDCVGPVTPENIREAQEAVDKGEAAFWVYSVYWHRREGGAEWVADYASNDYAGAEAQAESMRAALKEAA